MSVQISFITINYNSSSYTKELIDSIEKHTTIEYEIIVVDNDSIDQDKKTIQQFCADREHVKFIQNPTNCGFSCGNMRGVQEASGEFLFFINNDTKLLNDTAKILKNFLEKHNNVALATGTIVDENNKTASSYKLFPSLVKELFGNTAARKLNRFPSNKTHLTSPTPVEVVSGSFMFFRREAFFSIEGFDTNFFLYCEEEDISKRVWNHGFEVYFIPEAKIFHKGGGSAKQSYELTREYYISYTYLIKKHFNPLTSSLLYALMVFKLLRRAFKRKHGWRLLQDALKGFSSKQSLGRKYISED